jgi:glutamate-1-semialdehyde 2,1-aminomutase
MDYKERLHNVIPGGAHTYSRGDDQFPYNAPQILTRGEGAYVYDPEGKKYLDYGMGLRSVNIGYANKEVATAMYEEALKGNNLTRASITELEAAELMVELIDSVDMVKFAKHGSSVTTAAMKLARAYTGRKYICVPFEQPFFSFDDWFIGSTPLTRGIPEQNAMHTLKFHYNDIDSLKELFDKYPNEIAAVMLEPATTVSPCSDLQSYNNSDCRNSNEENFLQKVQKLCNQNKTVFILDEMITGFRYHLKGAQYYFNVTPDLCTFGKAMANGFAVAVLGGKREIMKIGGIQEEGAERVFLTSTTHGAEMAGLGAFIKTVEILKRENVVDHYWNYGSSLKNGIDEIAKELGISENFYTEGFACSPNYTAKDKNGEVSLPFRTLFSQEMIRNGVIMPYISLSFAHQQEELEFTLAAVRKSLEVYAKALNEGIDKYLKSTPIKPVFRKYN